MTRSLVAILAGCLLGSTPARAQEGVDAPRMFLEYDTTDARGGVHVFVDAHGWRGLRIREPAAGSVLGLRTGGGLADLGLVELMFTGVTPSPEEVLASFPEGTYAMEGRNVADEPVVTGIVLSHDLLVPPRTWIGPQRAVIHWTEVAGATSYRVVVENEAQGWVVAFDLDASRHRLRVPTAFLDAGQHLRYEVHAVAASGNRTVVGSTFSTAPQR